MTKINSKQDLKDTIKIRREIAQMEQQIKTLTSAIESISAVCNDGMPRTPGIHDRIGGNVARLDSLIRKYEDKIANLLSCQEEAETLISSLSTEKRIVCRYRYIFGYRWEDICAALNYSWRQIHRIHAAALEDLFGQKDKDGTQ